MGTNYYLQKNICKECKRHDEIHIGKSSAGWCFALHVDPPEIATLDDWKRLFNDPKNSIRNEYGETINAKEMLEIITERTWPPGKWPNIFGQTKEDLPRQSNCNIDERSNLARHKIDEYCSGHGEGSFDYCPGEFS